MLSDRIWPLRQRSRPFRKFASFWTQRLCFLFSMRSQTACCRSLRVRCRGVSLPHVLFSIFFFFDSCSFFLADTKLHPLDCSCLSHCSLGDGMFWSLFVCLVMLLKVSEHWYFVSLLSPPSGLNYLKPLQGPLSKMLQMLQECSQLELALRVLLNSHGSLLQHITSNVMDMKLSVQVWRAVAHINISCQVANCYIT